MTGSGRNDKPHEVDRAGSTIAGRFVIEARLAAGGSGVVWRARQEPLGRAVALKVLRTDAADPHAAARLLREGQALAALRHENLVAVHDAGTTEDGAPFVVMELVDGPSVRALLERGPLPWRDAVSIARGVARALEAAHGAGVIHRDLKPDNVLLSMAPGDALDPRTVRVVDFGLAKHESARDGAPAPPSVDVSSSAVLRGTPAYMSPEQAEGRPASARSDLYALGVLLYEALTGANPFRAETPLKTLLRHSEGPRPPAPSTLVGADAARPPAALDALTLALLAVDPNARPADARAVSRALDAIAAETPASSEAAAAPQVPLTRAAIAVERPLRGVSAVALAVIVLGVVAIGVGAFALARSRAADDDGVDAGATDVGVTDAGVTDAGGTETAPSHTTSPDALATSPLPSSPASPASTPADAGAPPPASEPANAATTRRASVDAGPSAPPPRTVPTKLRHLERVCAARVPCAAALNARYPAVMGGDLDALKRFDAELDACLAACALAEPSR